MPQMSATPPRLGSTKLVSCCSAARTRRSIGDTQYKSKAIPRMTNTNPAMDTALMISSLNCSLQTTATRPKVCHGSEHLG
jgi:hypothetical protein